MNKLDKSDVDLEIFFNRYLLRMNNEKLFKTLIDMYSNQKPQVISYILEKFQKKKCTHCDGMGFQSWCKQCRTDERAEKRLNQ